MALAAILLIPVLATLWTAWQKFAAPVPPAPVPLSLTGAGALAFNLACAFLNLRFRHHSGSLTRAAFLSARNDAYANVAIIAAGFVTAATLSVWPDLIVGLGIALVNDRCLASGAHGGPQGKTGGEIVEVKGLVRPPISKNGTLLASGVRERLPNGASR
jgi:hypothetical protein